MDDLLSEPQADAVRLAFESGFFERPRQCTQADLADAMGVDPLTYSQHRYADLQKPLAALFNNGVTDDYPSSPGDAL